MNTLIRSQVEFELTDKQLANISGGFDHDDHDDDHRDRGDDDDRRGRWGHCHPHWVWN